MKHGVSHRTHLYILFIKNDTFSLLHSAVLIPQRTILTGF